MIGNLYSIIEIVILVIVRECWKAIKDHLLLMIIRKMTLKKMKTIFTEFEVIKCIPYVTGAIDGFLIPIVGPVRLLQKIIVVKDFIQSFCRK